MKPKICPRCGCTKIQTVTAFTVTLINSFAEVVDHETYWTSFGREDVVRRVRENNPGYSARVANKSHDLHYSCETNSCYLQRGT